MKRPEKIDKWICLLCKSTNKNYHGTLDDKVTPCPNKKIIKPYYDVNNNR